jgi:hypothetical protein
MGENGNSASALPPPGSAPPAKDETKSDLAAVANGCLGKLGGYITDALRFWEPMRLVYNLALAAVVTADFFAFWPASKEKLAPHWMLGLFFLAVLANLCYCTAYIPDFFVQLSGWRHAVRLCRIILLTVGTAFGAVITHFFAYNVFSGGSP